MKQLGQIKYSYDSKYLYHKGRKNNHIIYINFCIEENKKFVRIYHPDNSIKVFYWFNNTIDAVNFIDNYINHNIVPDNIMKRSFIMICIKHNYKPLEIVGNELILICIKCKNITYAKLPGFNYRILGNQIYKI